MSDVLTQLLLYFGDFGKFISRSLAGIGVSGGSAGWLIGLFLVFVIFLVGFTLGRTKMFLALLSLYGAAFIEFNFPYFKLLAGFFKEIPEYWVHAGLLLIIYLIIFFALSRSWFRARLSTKEMSLVWIGILALLEVGLLISILASYLPSGNNILPSIVMNLFGTKTASFVWGILPIALSFFMRSKKTEPRE